MSGILGYISFGLFWIVVPGIMFSLIVFGRIIVNKSKNPEKKTSANAGWWAGVVLFVFVFIYHISSITPPHTASGTKLSVSIFGGIAGFIIGFTALWILKPLIKKRAIGIITLMLSFVGTTSLFSYFFIRNVNNILLSGTLGLALGTLLHIVFAPENIRDLFSE